MARFVLIFLLCITTTGITCAQLYQQRIDSLQRLLLAARADTERIRLLGEMSSAYAVMENPAKAFELSRQAVAISERVADPYFKALARHRLGYTYLTQAINDSGIIQYTIAKQLLEADSSSVRSKSLYVKCLNNLAFLYANNGYQEKAMELIISSLPVTEAIKDTFLYAAELHNISAELIVVGEYTRAYPYSIKDMQLMERTGKPEEAAESYLSGALLMYYMDSIPQAGRYLNKAVDRLRQMKESPLLGRYYAYKTLYHTGKKEYADAMRARDSAFAELKLHASRTNQYDANYAWMMLADAQGNYRQAREAAYAINRLAEEDSLSHYLLLSLERIADYSRKIGDLEEAYQYLGRYVHIKDSIDNKQMELKMSDMEAGYQATKKEQQIAALETSAKVQRYLLTGISILLGLAILFFVYTIRQRRIRAAQQVKLLEQQRQVDVTEALLKGEERERTRVARDLHDGLGGLLAGIKMNLSQIAGNDRPTKESELQQLIGQLGSSVNELRRIARDMVPEVLLRSGMQSALKDLCDNNTTAGTKVVFQAFNIRNDIPYRAQTMIYRMAQEILNNAVKHSGADRIMLQCSMTDNSFFITVEDNGSGFAPTAKSNGMGLSNIRSRVELMTGNMQVDTSNEGTIINIEVNVAV